MNQYMMIPIADLTTVMINRSVSIVLSEIPIYKKILDDTEYYLVEVENDNLKSVTTFDGYQWYSLVTIKVELEANWYQD